MELATDLPTSVADAPEAPMLGYRCFNGPCQDAVVEAPADATPGTACALPWKTIKGYDRYAVYVLVDMNGLQGLMYLGRSYDQPYHAAAKVERITALCAANLA